VQSPTPKFPTRSASTEGSTSASVIVFNHGCCQLSIIEAKEVRGEVRNAERDGLRRPAMEHQSN